MTNNNPKEKNLTSKKLILQYLLIICSVILSIYTIFYNMSHNYPNEFNTETVLTWFFPQIIFAFATTFILLGICSLLIANLNSSSLKDFLSLKNYIILFSIFMVISFVHYSFNYLQISRNIAENLMNAFIIFSALFIVLFIFIGVLSLIILRSISKR